MFVAACDSVSPRWPNRALPDHGSDAVLEALASLRQDARAAAEEEQLEPLIELCLGLEVNRYHPEAASCWEDAARLAPDEPAIAWHRYLVAESLGEPPEARLTVLEPFDRYPPALYARGELALSAGELAEAHELYSRLAEVAPDRAEGSFGLARIALESRDGHQARRWAERGLEIAPGATYGYYLLGRALRLEGDLEAAAIALRRGSGGRPVEFTDPWTLRRGDLAWEPAAVLTEARAARLRGDLSRAERWAQRAVQLVPANLEALRLLGALELAQGRVEASCTTVREVLRIEPDDLESRLHLANCSLALGEARQALEHAEVAVRLAPQVARGWQMRGRALSNCCQGRMPEARTSFERAAALSPHDSQIALELGRLCLWTQDLECSRSVFERLSAERPWEVWGHLGLAETLALAGDSEGAEVAIDTASRQAPGHPAVFELRRRLGLEARWAG